MSHVVNSKYPKRILIHPPEAERVAEAFKDSRTAAGFDLAALEGIHGTLDAGWEGNQKTRFQEEFNCLTDRIRKILLPLLQALENKFRNYTVEQMAEENETR